MRLRPWRAGGPSRFLGGWRERAGWQEEGARPKNNKSKGRGVTAQPRHLLKPRGRSWSPGGAGADGCDWNPTATLPPLGCNCTMQAAGQLLGRCAVGCGAAPLPDAAPDLADTSTCVCTWGCGAKGPHQAVPVPSQAVCTDVGFCWDCPRPHRLFTSFPGHPTGAALPPQSHGVGVKAHRGQQDDGGGLNPPRPTTFPRLTSSTGGSFTPPRSSPVPPRRTTAAAGAAAAPS